MQSSLEENNQQILLQKLEIRSLKDQIIRILEDRGTFPPGGMQNSNMSGNLYNNNNSSGTVGGDNINMARYASRPLNPA